MRRFWLANMGLALVGVVDALLWLGFGLTAFGQLFSLLELGWLALCLVALIVARQQPRVRRVAVLYAGYQLLLWGVGSHLAAQQTQAGLDFMPPDGMLLASLLFYGIYFIVCRHYYSVEK